MTELFKGHNNLAVLQITFDPSTASSSGDAVFTLALSGKTCFQRAVDCAELGLPDTLRQADEHRDEEPSYSIPDDVVQQIRKGLTGVLEQGQPLWLQFTNASGILPLLPWEHLLQPRLGVPIFRLPYFTLKPFSSSASLDIILCICLPDEKMPVRETLNLIIRRILSVQRERISIHVFTDARVYRYLYSFFDTFFALGDGKEVRLYNPAEAFAYPSDERLSTLHPIHDYLENPWLRWIVQALAGRSADVVHFVCDGYLSRDQGLLAFAPSPLRDEEHAWPGLVSSQQLATFLTHMGAWSVSFSSPPQNLSRSGLRLLADQVARLRPGPVLLHDLGEDDQYMTALAQAYRFLYSETQDRASLPTWEVSNFLAHKSAAVAINCHPNYVPQIALQETVPDQADKLKQYTLAKGETLKLLQSRENTPSWIASSQRYLEQSVAELFNEEPDLVSPRQNATRQGIGEALRLLSKVIANHASLAGYLKESVGPIYEAGKYGQEDTSPKFVIDVRNVTRSKLSSHERIDILEGINLQIPSGEFIAIEGPADSGNNTLLHIMAGLDKPTTGQVLIDGEDIARMPKEQLAEFLRDNVSTFLQKSYTLYPHMTVYDNMAFGLKLRHFPKDEIRERVEEAVEILGIQHLLKRKPKELSGGQRQRVALGRAIVLGRIVRGPKVYLMEEPPGKLDARDAEKTLQAIADLHAQTNQTIIIATQNPVVTSYANRIIHMVGGRITV